MFLKRCRASVGRSGQGVLDVASRAPRDEARSCRVALSLFCKRYIAIDLSSRIATLGSTLTSYRSLSASPGPKIFKRLLMGRLVMGSFRNLLAEPRGTAKTLEITAPKLCEQRSVTQMRKLPVYKLPIKNCPKNPQKSEKKKSPAPAPEKIWKSLERTFLRLFTALQTFSRKSLLGPQGTLFRLSWDFGPRESCSSSGGSQRNTQSCLMEGPLTCLVHYMDGFDCILHEFR